MDKRKSVLVLFSVLLLVGGVSAQSSIDGFEDGDYTNNPAWNVEFGTASNYQVTQASALNGTYGLELNNIGSERHRLKHSSSISQGEMITGWYNIQGGDLANLNPGVGLLADGSWGSVIRITGDGNININGNSCTQTDTNVDYNQGEWIKFGIKNEGGSTQRFLAWDNNGNNIINRTKSCADWSENIGVNTVAYAETPNSFTGTIYHDDIAFEGYVPSTTTPISNLTIDNPTDGQSISYEETSNGVQVDWSWDNPDSLDTTSEVLVNGNRQYLFSTSGTSDSTTVSQGAFNIGQSNTITVETDDGNNLLSQSISVTAQNPQHEVTSVTTSNPSVDMNLGSGVDITTNVDYNVEAGESVILYSGLTTQSSGSGYTCSSGVCSTSSSNTINVNAGTYTTEGEVTGQDSGYSDSATGPTVTVYDPSLTYNGPADGSTVSYPNRQQTLDYTWDSSNEESVTAYLYYNGNQIRTDNLSPGQSITETVEGEVGQNDWYVEVTGDTSGDTETFSTQTFTVSDPVNSVTLVSPTDTSTFNAGTSSVDLSADYNVEESGTLRFYVDGVQEKTVSLTEGSVGSNTYTHNTNSGQSYNWYVEFDGDTNTNDKTTTTRSFSILSENSVANITSPVDGSTISWTNRDVTVNWDSESNEDYTTSLNLDGVEQYNYSYAQGSNSDSELFNLGDGTQDTTYSFTAETVGDTTGTYDNDTISITVEQPVLSQSVSLDSPADTSSFSYSNREVDLNASYSTNDVSDVRLYYDGSQVNSLTDGTQDRTVDTTGTISSTLTGTVGQHSWYAEIDHNGQTETTPTRTFTIDQPQNSVNLTDIADNTEFDSGTTSVIPSVEYNVEELGVMRFYVNGVEEYNNPVDAGQSGEQGFNFDTQSGTTYDWYVVFDGDTGTNDITTNTRSFTVLQSLASVTPVSPNDGQTFSWDQRDVQFEWNSEANDDYTTRLYVNNTLESSSSYSRGSNVDTHTMTLGNADQDTTYSYYVETEDVNGNIDTSNTRTFTVEKPELSESASLTSPANESEFAEFLVIDLEGQVETNDVSEYRIIVDGTTVKSETIGTADRTDTVSQSVSYSSSFSQGNHTWKIEIGNNESETRQFTMRDEVLDFTYNTPNDGEVFREGINTVDYSMDITHERNGTVSILKNGNTIYSETVNVSSEGNPETKTITYTESVSGNPTSVTWKGQFEDGSTFQDSNSSSYEIEELPSAVLDSPKDGVYFRNLPESVAHDFNISETENEVTSELIVNGEVEETFTGSGQKTGIIDYLEEDVGKQNWTVNTTWTQDTGVERDTETREYNTGDPDIAEGRAIDSMIKYVSDNLGMSYLGAAIMINLTLSMLFAVAVMYSTKSVGYTLLTFGTAFFGLGIIGFLPNILIILLGIAAVSVLTIYAWKFTFGGDNE